MTGKSLQWPLAAVLITAALLLTEALWIPLKAQLAQVLLSNAWERTRQGEPTARPWPWADTSPVGLLEIPGMAIRQIVLEGASGRNLAFGPTALTPIDHPDLVLSGHRDTHFRFLGDLQRGEKIRLTTASGRREFQVIGFEIIDSRVSELVLDPGAQRLTLVTCYPLDAAATGGPLRLVVTAQATNRRQVPAPTG
jgi:sortase A